LNDDISKGIKLPQADEEKYKREMARPEKVMKSMTVEEWDYLYQNREVVDAIKKYKKASIYLEKVLDKI